MFIGFIAVLVILLAIVGVMSSGTTTSSGGQESAKAAKIKAEISQIKQASMMYKTSSTDGSYTGLTPSALLASGVVKGNQMELYTTAGQGADNPWIVEGGDLADTSSVIISKSIIGVYYTVSSSASDQFEVGVIVDPTVLAAGSTQVKAIEKIYSSLYSAADVAHSDAIAITNASATDGVSSLSFN